jgi:hypothetical protein
MALIKAGQENIEVIMETCLEKTEATDFETNVRVGASGKFLRKRPRSK